MVVAAEALKVVNRVGARKGQVMTSIKYHEFRIPKGVLMHGDFFMGDTHGEDICWFDLGCGKCIDVGFYYREEDGGQYRIEVARIPGYEVVSTYHAFTESEAIAKTQLALDDWMLENEC